MSLFPISADKVQLSTDAPVATDSYVGGLLRDAGNTVCRAALSGGVQWSNGLLMTALGQVVYVDATAGLPAGTQFVNGIPLAPSGAMCCSTDAAVNYSNGLPRVLNGAIAATGADLSAQVAALFAAGMKGIWRESSRAGVRYVENTGVTPANTPGDTLGLILSLDQGGGRGAELVPTLDLNAVPWSKATGTVVITGTNMFTTPAASSGMFWDGLLGATPREIILDYSKASGSVLLGLYDVAGSLPLVTSTAASGVLSCRYVPSAQANQGRIYLRTPTAEIVTVNSISIRSLPGNHQSQPTTQSRPLYQVSPPRPVFDGIDDVLNTTFAAALGANCTVGRYVPGTGVVILTGQNIGTTFADSVTSGPLVVLDGPLNAGQTATLTAYLTQQGTLT